MWTTIGIVYIVGMIWLAWEAWNAPIMPDDYNTKINKKQLKKQQK